MLKIVLKATYDEDKIDEAIELYSKLIDESRKEEGCLEYKLFQDVNDKTVLTIIEEWKDQESIDKHSNSEHYKKYVPAINSFRKSREINVYKLVK